MERSVTQNDTPGTWMEMTPMETPSTTVTLTRAKPVEFASTDAMTLVAITLGVVGIIALVIIVYLIRKERI